MVGVIRIYSKTLSTIWSARLVLYSRKAVVSSASGSPHGSVITKAPPRGGPEHWCSKVSFPLSTQAQSYGLRPTQTSNFRVRPPALPMPTAQGCRLGAFYA